MESVMNFLAEYYIWFFVGAIVLCFALIGFIIDARKKKKNEFKGDAIEENPVVQNNTQATNTTPQVVGNTVNVGGEATLGSTNTVSEATMEINDIPMAPSTPVETQPENKVEFYSGPVEMPVAQPAPVNNTNVTVQPETTVPIGEPITMDAGVTPQVAQPQPVVNPVQSVERVVGTPEQNTTNPSNMN